MPSPTPTPTNNQPDMVVVATRSSVDNTWIFQRRLRTAFDNGGGAGGSLPSPGGGGTDGSGANTTVVIGVVNVQVENPANLNDAIAAAEVVGIAIAKMLEDSASKLDSDLVVVGNYRSTVGKTRYILTNTEWVITDKSFINLNGGVGASFRRSDGSTTDYLNFNSFKPGPTGYAATTYTNMQGLVGILLHEIGHLSQIGTSFNSASFSAYLRINNNSEVGWVGSRHYINNEVFANDFLKAAAGAAGLDISTFNPRYAYGHVTPSQIKTR